MTREALILAAFVMLNIGLSSATAMIDSDNSSGGSSSLSAEIMKIHHQSIHKPHKPMHLIGTHEASRSILSISSESRRDTAKPKTKPIKKDCRIKAKQDSGYSSRSSSVDGSHSFETPRNKAMDDYIFRGSRHNGFDPAQKSKPKRSIRTFDKSSRSFESRSAKTSGDASRSIEAPINKKMTSPKTTKDCRVEANKHQSRSSSGSVDDERPFFHQPSKATNKGKSRTRKNRRDVERRQSDTSSYEESYQSYDSDESRMFAKKKKPTRHYSSAAISDSISESHSPSYEHSSAKKATKKKCKKTPSKYSESYSGGSSESEDRSSRKNKRRDYDSGESSDDSHHWYSDESSEEKKPKTKKKAVKPKCKTAKRQMSKEDDSSRQWYSDESTVERKPKTKKRAVEPKRKTAKKQSKEDDSRDDSSHEWYSEESTAEKKPKAKKQAVEQKRKAGSGDDSNDSYVANKMRHKNQNSENAETQVVASRSSEMSSDEDDEDSSEWSNRFLTKDGSESYSGSDGSSFVYKKVTKDKKKKKCPPPSKKPADDDKASDSSSGKQGDLMIYGM